MPAGHYDQHPAYRNQAYLVGKKIKFGQDRTMVPNWEVEVSRGVPWFGETTLDPDDRGVNAAGVLFDWLTDPIFGLGFPEARLHEASFEAVKDAIDDLRISPLITGLQDARSIVGQLLEYPDLWLRRSGTQLELGRWQHGAIDVDALPTIGSDELTAEPDMRSYGYGETVNMVRVAFRNREKYFHDDISAPAFDASNFRIVGELRELILQRPWITDEELANRYGIEYLNYYSRPRMAGTQKVKREAVTTLGLLPGSLFRINSASYGLTLALRLIELEWPADRDGSCTLTLENERSIGPVPYVQPPAPGPGNFQITPIAIVNKRIWELPSGLKTSNRIQIAVLAQRPSPLIVGFRVHASPDDETYDLLAAHNNFAAFGKVVTADYPDSTADLDTLIGIQFELFGVDNITSQTDTQRDDNNLLLVVDNEVMSVGEVSALGAGKYKAFVRRELFGTEKATHAIDAHCWFILRERLVRIENQNFARSATVFFKLQPFTAQQELLLTDVTAFTYLFHSAPAVGSVFNLALTSNAYTDEQGERRTVILAAWDYLPDQDIIIFGVAYRRTEATGMLYNADQALTFELSAKGGTAGEESLGLSAVGTNEPASLVRVWNPDQELWFDVISTGPLGEETFGVIPAADPAPGFGLSLFNLDQNVWFELTCTGAAGEEVLGLSAGGEAGLGPTPSVPSDLARPWVYVTIDVPDIAIPVTSGVSYDVKVRPINSLGEAGEYCDVESIIAGAIDLFQIDNLEIAGQGEDHTLRGVDCHLAWEIISPSQGTSIRGGPSGASSGGGGYDPGLVDFEIKIYEGELTLEEIEEGGAGVVRVWRDVSRVPEYNFSLERNAAAWSNMHEGAIGAYPVFTVWVGGYDPSNRTAAAQVITVTKAPPAMVTSVEMISTLGAIDLAWINPVGAGLDRIEIYLGGYLSDIIRQVSAPATTHHFNGLMNGSIYKFLLQSVDKFGLRSALYETPWSPSVGLAGLDPVVFSPNGGDIVDGDPVVLASPNPGAQIYWRADGSTPTIDDTLYTGGIPITDEVDITAIAYLDGFYSAPTTRHFVPFTPGGGGGGGDPVVAPSFDPPSGSYDEGITVIASTPTSGDVYLYYTRQAGGGIPLDPSREPDGDPIAPTLRVHANTLNFGLFDPPAPGTQLRIKMFASKTGVGDSAISSAIYNITIEGEE